MSTLDFTDSEPAVIKGQVQDADSFTGNAAFYERLQGRKKKGIERYGWVVLPIAAVAILGVVAATSTPHSSADDVVGAPGKTNTAATTPAPAVQVAQASTDDVTPAAVQSPSAIREKIDSAPAAIQTPSSAPAPVRVAKRAPVPAKAAPRSDAVTTAPASATATTRIVPAPEPVAPAPSAAPVEATPPAASAPAEIQAPVVPAAPAAAPEVPAQPAPADTAPAQ